jgi:CelD/BcsL family acetyltransferase involved in cellulose biosynthesis
MGNDAAMGIDSIDIYRGQIPHQADGGAWRSTPFQSERWLASWHAAFGAAGRTEPIAAVGRSGERTAFILPLGLERRMGALTLTPLAMGHSDYDAPLLNPDCAEDLASADGKALLQEIARKAGGVDLVYFAKQQREVGGIANPFVMPGAFDYHAGAHAIQFLPGESFEAFLLRRRSGKTRRRLREKRAGLEKSGPVSFRVAQQQAEARTLIDMCLAAKSRQLKRLGHWDPFAEPANRNFLIDFFSGDIGRSTWTAALDVAGKVAVTSFGFRHGDAWLLYQMAMEEDAEARYSPGTHHLTELIRHCIDERAGCLDLSIGDESYKSEWCDLHTRLAVSLLPLTPKGWLVSKLIEARGRTRLRMASDPKLYERARRLKGLLQVFRLPL